MSYSTSNLKIAGYRNMAVPNTFRRQEAAAQHLLLAFPGRGYSADMPLLYYPTELFLNLGADVLSVEYDYVRSPEFRTISEAERTLWISADVSAACDVALAQRNYSHVTLIGKSLGTLAMAYLLSSDPRLANASAIWLTPLLGSDTLREQIGAWRGHSLFIGGTADPAWLPRQLAEVRDHTNGAVLSLPDADHSLEIPGDLWRSLDYLQQTMRAINDFLK